MATDHGTDLSCTWDLTDTCTVVSGRRCLAEAIFRRLITPRGRLIDDPDYGTDVTGYINDDVTVSEVNELRAAIIDECNKDERVLDADCEIEGPPGGVGQTGAYTITVTLYDADGPFALVLGIADVAAQPELLKVTGT